MTQVRFARVVARGDNRDLSRASPAPPTARASGRSSVRPITPFAWRVARPDPVGVFVSAVSDASQRRHLASGTDEWGDASAPGPGARWLPAAGEEWGRGPMVRLRAGRRHQQIERERAILPVEATSAPLRRRTLLIRVPCEERAGTHASRRRAAADGSPAWPVVWGWPLTRLEPGQPRHYEGERSEPVR